MDWSSIVASTVLATIISVVANLLLQRIKNKNQIKAYRYKELHRILQEIEKEHGFRTYPDNPKKTVEEASEKRLVFLQYTQIAKPLVSKEIQLGFDEAVNNENNAFETFIKNRTDEVNLEKYLQIWFASLNSLLRMLRDSIQEQIILLM